MKTNNEECKLITTLPSDRWAQTMREGNHYIVIPMVFSPHRCNSQAEADDVVRMWLDEGKWDNR